MLRRNLMTGLAAAAVAQAVSAASHAEWKNRFAQQLRDDFRAHWKSEKEYSLAVLEAMPAEHFDFKPTPEQRSFSEQVAHFTSANMGYFVRFAKSAAPPPRPDKVTPEALRAFLLGTYDYVDKVLESLTEADFTRRDIAMGRMPAHTAQDVFLRAYMHSAHHRGSVVAYLRLKGVEPPAWRFPGLGEG